MDNLESHNKEQRNDQKVKVSLLQDKEEVKCLKNGSTDSKTKNAQPGKRVQRILRILLFLPYILAPVWTCLHPVISILTGEMKCRGWYLDEHSIETRFVDGQNPNEVPSHLKNINDVDIDNRSGPLSLCDFFAGDGAYPEYDAKNLICHSHGGYFDFVMIKPLSNAIDATEEAVVLVVPAPNEITSHLSDSGNATSEMETETDWGNSRLHQAMIQMIKHLADPVRTPWLAKCVFVVTPSIDKTSRGPHTGSKNSGGSQLEDIVSSFLDAYLGRQEMYDYQINQQSKRTDPLHQQEGKVPQLPLSMCGAILRNLIVLQMFHESPVDKKVKGRKKNNDRSTDLAILPQGRRGVLPNADLVFLVGQLMQRTSFFKTSNRKTFLTHPHTKQSKDATVWSYRKLDGFDLDKRTTNKFKVWASGMIDMSLFARTLAIGPVPPHAPALDRGIDSLTIRVTFDDTSTFFRDPVVEFVQYTEYLVRSMSNLHERLHHSFTLYLLPTPKQFVSHIEYLLPNILLLLPLAVRTFGFLLPAMKGGFDLDVMGGVFLALIVIAIGMVLVDGEPQTANTAILILYVGIAIYWIRRILPIRKCYPSSHEESDKEQTSALVDDSVTRKILTLQFLSCVISVHILVPIAFANASLSYLPSLLWSPLFAFLDYPSMKRCTRTKFVNYVTIPVLVVMMLITAPPSYLVPHIFSSYTPFVKFAYVPLHMLFSLLVISIIAL